MALVAVTHGAMSRLRLLAPATALALAIPMALFTTAAQAAVPSGGGTAAVTIDGATRYQQISGFGASEAFGQAQTIMDAPSATQKQVLNLLYSWTSGAGLTILRNEISADAGSTIEPKAPSGPNATPTYLPLSSIDEDQGQLWFAQKIKAEYGVTDVFADAWSAPAFMKTNHSADNGGAVCGVPGATCSSGDWRQAYANYLKQYAADYAAAGDRLTYVGPENEADFGPDYDSMIMSPSQTANFLDVLGPTMATSGLGTRVECCATEGWNYAAQYAAAIESDPVASRYVPVFTSHGYSGAPGSLLPGWTEPVWETEWSTFQSWDPAWDDGTTASGFAWAQNIYTGLTAANLNAFLYWWGTSTPSEGGDNESLVQVNGTTVNPSGRLWAFANYSRFVRPGAVRIGTSTSDGSLEVTAFGNVNGSVAVVVLNTAKTPQTVGFSLSQAGDGVLATPYLTNASHDTAAQPALPVQQGSFTATLPARSLVTYQIPAA